jgi:DMSO/TMAO reductase YedYZ molybdopterin-dependent catalytic subunit
MKAIFRTLGLYFLVILLSSCQLLSSQPDTELESSPSPGVAQTVIPAPTETVLHATPTKTAERETDTVTPSLAAATPSFVNNTPGECQLVPVTQPPWPVKTLSPNEFDPEADLHMTGKPQQIDLATYRLNVTGLVDHPLSLTYDELRCMPKVTDNPDLICYGVFIDYATWTGVPLEYILELAGVQPEATQLNLVSADGYEVHIPLEKAREAQNFLAYQVNGEPLPVLHGFPLRAVFPTMGGSYWLKWLIEIHIS